MRPEPEHLPEGHSDYVPTSSPGLPAVRAQWLDDILDYPELDTDDRELDFRRERASASI